MREKKKDLSIYKPLLLFKLLFFHTITLRKKLGDYFAHPRNYANKGKYNFFFSDYAVIEL